MNSRRFLSGEPLVRAACSYKPEGSLGEFLPTLGGLETDTILDADLWSPPLFAIAVRSIQPKNRLGPRRANVSSSGCCRKGK